MSLRPRLLVVLMLSLFCAAPASAAPVRVCIVGDSISEGFAPATRGWGSYLLVAHRTLSTEAAGTADFAVKNVAHSGDLVAAQQLVFDKELAGATMRGCTHLFVAVSTNDLAGGTAATTIHSGMLTFCAYAAAHSVKCGLLYPLPRGTGASASADLETRRRQLISLLAADAGAATAWAGSTAYTVGTVVTNGGRRYICTVAGTSASSGGPSAATTDMTDGTVHWAFVPTGALIAVDTDTPLREAQNSFTGTTPTAWASSTAYTVGTVVRNNGYRFICKTSGTSASSGGPNLVGTYPADTSITDGTAVWTLIPALASGSGGATDGLHPNNTGEQTISSTADSAAHTAGWW